MSMVRLGVVIIFIVGLLQAKIDKRYQTNVNCQACHIDISRSWENSRHAHSHFTKNELYNSVLEHLVANNIVETKEEVVVRCAKCHNPRIEKRKISDVEKIAMLLEIDKDTLDRMINSAYMKNGINCIVCHNVKRIEQNGTTVGFDAVKFGPQGVMYGPFKGAKSPYHFTKEREFFKEEPNRLCLVCHLRGFNSRGVKVYATGEEYLAYERLNPKVKVQNCVDCHMSREKKGVASNYQGKGGMVRREVRDHLFIGVGSGRIEQSYIDINVRVRSKNVFIEVANRTPHKLPTGYGLREVRMEITFYDKKRRITGKKGYSFSVDWLNQNGHLTIPHLSREIGEDKRLEAGGSKRFIFLIPHETKFISYRLIYRRLKKDMQRVLNIKDSFFTKDYILKDGTLEL